MRRPSSATASLQTRLFALVFGASGVGHFAIPAFFVQLIPAALPWRRFWVYLSGGVELLVAAGLLLPATRRRAAQGILGLLLLFTPLHVIDLLREKPVAVNRAGASIRLLVQGLLIALARQMTREA